MKIAICDDEEPIRSYIRELALSADEGCIAHEYSSGDELLKTGERCDIYFLDIKLPGTNGVCVARKLRTENREAVIVFVTGSKEYVFDAFDVRAFHYLVKPIDPDKFTQVFKSACREYMDGASRQEKKILIRTKKCTETVLVNDIYYAESQLKKMLIHTKERSIEYYGRINELERQLGEPFYRCHRGYLVNMSYIAGYDGSSITLTNGDTVFLAKERYADFVKSYLDYLKNGGVSFV